MLPGLVTRVANSHVKKQVLSLIERAVHPTTPEEEARTSALIACRLIQKHGLLLASAPPSAGFSGSGSYTVRPERQRVEVVQTIKTRKRKVDIQWGNFSHFDYGPRGFSAGLSCIQCKSEFQNGEAVIYINAIASLHAGTCSEVWLAKNSAKPKEKRV